MQYRQLGHSGLLVSELVLGTVPFGGGAEFAKCGAVDAATAKRMFDIAFEAGVNMVDTADLYSHGLAEEVVGQALGEYRNNILVASKGRSPVDKNPNNSGSSRYHLIRACEASLKRLRTDHIDLYHLHNWDGLTPIEETLEALDHLVSSGKIRYFGTSNFTAWQMMKTLGKAELNGFLKPITQQIYYTPESREAEYELLPLALDQSIGTLVWGPMGEGLLTGSTRRGQKPAHSHRQGTDWPEPYVHDQERALDIIETLASVGEEHGVSVARVCLAWLKDRPGITSLIVGARSEEQLHDNLAAADLHLSEEQTSRIEAITRRQPLYPYWHRFTAGIDRFDAAEQPFLAEHRQTMAARQDK